VGDIAEKCQFAIRGFIFAIRELGPQTQLRFIEYSTEIKTFEAFRSAERVVPLFLLLFFSLRFFLPFSLLFSSFLRINAENGIQRAHFLLLLLLSWPSIKLMSIDHRRVFTMRRASL